MSRAPFAPSKEVDFVVVGSGAAGGVVTSGTQSPSLNIGIGMGYVAAEHAQAGTEIEIEIRGRRFPAVVVRKPIYKRSQG